MKHTAPLRKRERILKQVPPWELIIRGTLMEYRRTCGNRGCRCYRATRHRHGPYWYLAVRWAKGRQKLVAIRPSLVPRIRHGVAAYKKLWKDVYAIADLNLKILLSQENSKEERRL
jgi:hypothetical protein